VKTVALKPQPSDDQLTGSEEEEMAFLEGYAPAESEEADWQHITTDSDAGSDYSTLTEGSGSSDNILSLENQAQLADIAKKTQEKLVERQKQKGKASGKKRKLTEDGEPEPTKKRLTNKAYWKSVKKYRRQHSGIIYLGDVPHGFYEPQMRRFFRQFGRVDRVRVARNKRGKTRHFAFVEFCDAEVAKIVADAMDGYLIFKHKLRAKVVPRERVYPSLFTGWGPKGDNDEWHQKKRKEGLERSKVKSAATLNRRIRKKTIEDQEKLKKLGIDYEFPEFDVMKP